MKDIRLFITGKFLFKGGKGEGVPSWYCPLGTVPLVLPSWYCPLGTVPLVLSPWYCPLGTVPLVLPSWYCPLGTVPLVLSPWYCPLGTVPLVLPVGCPLHTPFKSFYGAPCINTVSCVKSQLDLIWALWSFVSCCKHLTASKSADHCSEGSFWSFSHISGTLNSFSVCLITAVKGHFEVFSCFCKHWTVSQSAWSLQRRVICPVQTTLSLPLSSGRQYLITWLSAWQQKKSQSRKVEVTFSCYKCTGKAMCSLVWIPIKCVSKKKKTKWYAHSLTHSLTQSITLFNAVKYVTVNKRNFYK